MQFALSSLFPSTSNRQSTCEIGLGDNMYEREGRRDTRKKQRACSSLPPFSLVLARTMTRHDRIQAPCRVDTHWQNGIIARFLMTPPRQQTNTVCNANSLVWTRGCTRVSITGSAFSSYYLLIKENRVTLLDVFCRARRKRGSKPTRTHTPRARRSLTWVSFFRHVPLAHPEEEEKFITVAGFFYFLLHPCPPPVRYMENFSISPQAKGGKKRKKEIPYKLQEFFFLSTLLVRQGEIPLLSTHVGERNK
jgi:hypothetical protein